MPSSHTRLSIWPMISLGCSTPLRIQRTHLLGLSMGWMIALEFALRHGHRLDRLVLTGTGARARPQRGRSDRDLELGQVERPDRRRVRWATVRVALLLFVPPQPP